MDKDTKPTITTLPTGPFLVKDVGQLTDAKGNALPPREKVALCRCGHSANKPFCDGTHGKVGFDFSRQSDGKNDKLATYEGKAITVHDNRAACAHAGKCTSGLPSVWRMKERPWIHPDSADADAVAAIVHSCPSGALTYSVDGEVKEQAGRTPGIQVTAGGPYHVQGGVELDGGTFAEGQSKEGYTLCRCGHSKNKPFCDGSHYHAKFDDPGVPKTQD